MDKQEKAWVLIYTDIDSSREGGPIVYLTEKKAEEDLSDGLSAKAESQLEQFPDLEQEDKELLQSIIKAHKEKRYADAISDWDEWRSNNGPLDEDIEMVEAQLVQ